MTVKELKDYLSQFPDDLPVIRTCCSDYDDVEPGQISLVNVLMYQGRYIGENPNVWPAGQVPLKQTCVHFSGN